MDARNRDELLRKKEDLEAYLLDHPDSSLFGWYARQNMESGELDRAIKICRLGLAGGANAGLLNKLIGECYLAKGEVTQAMKHFVKVVLTGDPLPSVIIELIRNLGDTLETEQIAYLVKQLNQALPGHPEATRFYQKYPTARNLHPSQHQIEYLEALAESLVRSTTPTSEPPKVETEAPVETAIPAEIPPPAETIPPPADAPVAVKPEIPPRPVEKPADPKPSVPEPLVPPPPDPQTETEMLEPEEVERKPVVPRMTPKLIRPEPEMDLPPPPRPKPAPPTTSRQASAVKHTITRSMATFTLMQIFKDQGMYENALEVLAHLRETSSNKERIEKEYKEIQALMKASQDSAK